MAVTMTTTLVNRLAATSEKTNFLVMRENVHCRAKRLFRFFLRKSVKNVAQRTFLILLQTHSTDFDPMPGLTVCSLFNELATTPDLCLRQKLTEFADSCDATKANRVFIDSLNPLMLMLSLTEIHSLLSLLSQKSDSIVTTVSDEVIDDKQSALIRRIASADIALSSVSQSHDVNAVITYKRKHRTLGFKVEKKEEVIRFKDGDQDIEVVKAEHQSKTIAPAVSTTDSDFSKLTFNLSLSESERMAKEKVSLPYVK